MPKTKDGRTTFEEEALPHLDSVYRYARHLCGDGFLAEDLTQETMVKAFRAWSSYRPGSNMRAWLFTSLRNTLISQYRRKSRRAETAALFIREGPKVRAGELAQLEDALRGVEQARKKLEKKARQVLGGDSP